MLPLSPPLNMSRCIREDVSTAEIAEEKLLLCELCALGG